MKILIIDNYDSFTYNLFQQVASITKSIPDVFKNDEITYEEIVKKDYDCVIISPGPGRPEVQQDFGVCNEVLLSLDKPVLGVCLGHQGIGHYSGGEVVHAPEPYHGRLTPIYHNNKGLFNGLPQGYKVVRYHSLMVAPQLPENIIKSAWTKDGLIMGIEHKTKPLWGIQFHPESISTEYGNAVIERFLSLAKEYNKKKSKAASQAPNNHLANSETEHAFIEHKVVELDAPSEVIFYNLFGKNAYSFWLDSSKLIKDQSRFSIMGAVEDQHDKAILFERNKKELSIITDGKKTVLKRDLFEYLSDELDNNYISIPEQFPFNFNGGFIGYFGYELKSELDFVTSHNAEVPDAALIFSKEFLVIDHNENKIYIVSIAKDQQEKAKAQDWIDQTANRLKSLAPLPSSPKNYIKDKISFYGSQDHDTYIENIKKCLTEIRNGETYEVCLTNRLSAELQLDPFDLYLNLRKVNPAQYSAYLHFDDFSILSSSPEQFLRLDKNKTVSTKPIKGTIAKGVDAPTDLHNKEILQGNEKFRSENLMIVDLLRNDLGKVCEIGSVTVPALMAVEAYETLNHLVSTVIGKLKPEFNIIGLLKATFPGGSITGAPKKRTMEIIDKLETDARGPYTGALGFLSLCGAAELNIIIRTIVLTENKATIGTGGAIIFLSDPEEEFEEILLKAFPLIKAVVVTAKGSFDPSFYDLDLYRESGEYV